MKSQKMCLKSIRFIASLPTVGDSLNFPPFLVNGDLRMMSKNMSSLVAIAVSLALASPAIAQQQAGGASAAQGAAVGGVTAGTVAAAVAVVAAAAALSSGSSGASRSNQEPSRHPAHRQ